MTTAEFLASLESLGTVGVDDLNYGDLFFDHASTQDTEEAEEEVVEVTESSIKAASSSTFLKNGFRGFRGFRNTSVKFPKTLGKHIPLNIGEREEKKEHVKKKYWLFR